MSICHFCGSTAGNDWAGRCKTCGGAAGAQAEDPKPATTRKISNSQRQQVARTRSKMWRAAGAPGSQWVQAKLAKPTPQKRWGLLDFFMALVTVVGFTPVVLGLLFGVAHMFFGIWGFDLTAAFWAWEASDAIVGTLQSMCLGGFIGALVVGMAVSATQSKEASEETKDQA